jgi:flavin-dependent dehydrogenase
MGEQNRKACIMTDYDYDVIIAGGGMSGLVTAASIGVHSKQKARVLVVDRNPPTDPGKKTMNGWTCGDAVSKRSVDYIFENLGIRYGSPELEHPVEGVLVYSPDHETKVLFDGEGFTLNRKLMPRRQVEDAKMLGVEFAFNVAIDEVLAENGRVVGVAGRDTKNGTPFRKTARVVIDSAGSATTLRRTLPIKTKIDIEVDRDDLESTGRYIYEFETGAEDPTWFDPRYAIIHLDQYLAPGGYCLAPDTPVVCQNSVKPIQEVKMGDEVLTTMGWIPVADTSVRQFKGELVSIIPSMLSYPIKLTPDHLVRVWNPTRGESWKKAEDLVRSTHKGDYLVFPLPKSSATFDELDVSEYCEGTRYGDHIYVNIPRGLFSGRARDGSYARTKGSAKHPKGTKLPAKIKLDSDFLELCGWYVSVGCIKRGHVTISNSDEKLTDRITGILDRLQYRWLRWDTKEGGEPCHNIEITNSLLGSVFSKCFGVGAHSKKLPFWAHNLSREQRLALLKGMYQGDGSLAHKNGGRSDRRCYTTLSRSLAFDTWIFLAGIRVVGSVKRLKKKDAWEVAVSGYQAGFLGEALKSKNQQRNGFFIGDGCVYLRIKELDRARYSGPVYDINSAGDFTPLFSVHNCWTFAKGNNKVNIGLGVQKSALDKRNAKYGKKDTLQTLIDEYVHQNKSLKNPIQSPNPNDAGNTKGSWQVSVRRHNDCLVANGYALVGDAGWMARPIDAGGMGPAIYAGVILGRIVSQALESNDTSEAGLWQYNIDYMKLYGFQMASFEILRRYLQTLTNEQISYGMKYFLSEEDVRAIVNREHPKFGRLKLLNPAMLARVAAHPDLARGLQYTAKKSEELITHNLEYPKTPEGFDQWKKKLLSQLQEAYDRF